jgi:D-alanyl-D-alanine carboxypeptidase
VTPTTVAVDAPAPGSTEPIKPNTVKTVIVHPGSMQTASLSPLPSDNRQLTPAPAVANAANITTINTVKSDSTPPQLPPPQLPPSQAAPPPPVSAVAPPPPGAKPGILGTLPAKIASVSKSVPVPVAAVGEPAVKRSGWLVQVGAFDDEKDAKQRLDLAQSKAKDLLGRAEPFTEKTAKGEKTMFRARFAGLEKDRAEAVCKQLKRNEIPCMFLKN